MLVPRFSPAFTRNDLASEFAGPVAVARFERALADRLECADVIALPKGRTALWLHLAAQPARGRVILPAYTCLTLPPAVYSAGCEPVFVDCEADGFGMDPDAALAAAREGAIAAVPTPLFGCPLAPGLIESLRALGISVCLDAALSLGLCLKHGIHRNADSTLLAFGLGKELPTVSGGALVVRDAALGRRARRLWESIRRRPTWGSAFKRRIALPAAGALFRRELYPMLHFVSETTSWLEGEKGRNVTRDLPVGAYEELMPFQADLGLRRLDRLDRALELRSHQAARYRDGLAPLESPDFRLPSADGILSAYAIRTPLRDAIAARLLKAGYHAGTRVFDYVAGSHPVIGSRDPGAFPRAERLASETLLLPLHEELDDRDLDRIVAEVRRAVSAGG